MTDGFLAGLNHANGVLAPRGILRRRRFGGINLGELGGGGLPFSGGGFKGGDAKGGK